MGKLSREERDILQSFERGEWKPTPKLEAEKKKFRKAALSTLKKERVSIQLSSKEVHFIQKSAAKEGVSYEDFISRIIQRYVSSRLNNRKTPH